MGLLRIYGRVSVVRCRNSEPDYQSGRIVDFDGKVAGMQAFRGAHRTFECLVCTRVAEKVRKKLDAKAKKAVLLKLISYVKYRLLLVEERKITISRYVKVVEDVLPMMKWKGSKIVPAQLEHEEGLEES